MKMLVEIDSEKQVVVPKDLIQHAIASLWDYSAAAPFGVFDRDCTQALEDIVGAAPPPEPVQPDFDPVVPEHALIAGAKALELAMQSGITSPRTLALVAYTDIALTLHKSEQQPAQPIPTAERLPTEADADCDGLVWVWHSQNRDWLCWQWSGVGKIGDFAYWLPTNLTRPPAPGGDENGN